MADLSKLSDADLKSLYASQARGPQAMSDDELRAAYASSAPQEPGSAIGRAARFADDLVRQAANGATFGLADRAAAWLGGSRPDEEAQRTKDAQERTGLAGTAANIAGSMVPAAKIAQGVGYVAGMAPRMYGIGSVAANPYAQAAAGGAVYGGTDAAIQGDNIGQGAALGAGAGVVGQGVASALTRAASGAAGMFSRQPKIPTAEDVRQGAQAAYGAADSAGVIVRPEAVSRLRDNMQRNLAEFGYAPEINPGVSGVLNNLARNEGQNVTLKGLETLRRTANNLGASIEPSTRKIGQRLKGEIDGFIDDLKPGDVLAGDSRAAVDAMKEARSLWQRSSKAEALAEALGKAELRAASTGSGGNVDNATRQNVRRLLESRRDWTPDERAALEDIVRGTATQNALRLAGKLSPGGNGLMTALNVGAIATNPLMAAGSIGAAGAKFAADRMTGANTRLAEDIILAGGNRAAARAQPNALQRAIEAQRAGLGRALAVGGYEELAPELTIKPKQRGLLD